MCTALDKAKKVIGVLCCEITKACRVLQPFGVAESASSESREELCVHINTLAVHLDHRRHGIAGALLGRVLASRPEKTVYVETQSTNDDAKSFYERQSFSKVAECANYYKRCLSKDKTAWLYRYRQPLKKRERDDENIKDGQQQQQQPEAKVARRDNGK